MKIMGYALLFLMLAAGAHAAPTNPPAVAVSVDFAQVTAVGNNIKLEPPTEWIGGIRQSAGRFQNDAWLADESLAYGQGELIIRLNRDELPADLALTLIYEETPYADFVIQLWDEQDKIVALDLFSNIITVGQEAKTDTFIIPFAQYPTATQIVLRRLIGNIKIYGMVLMPVACEAPAITCDELELAIQLGDQLSEDNPLVLEANRIARAQQRALAWGSRTIQKPTPLSEINEIGSEALARKDYPEYSPAVNAVAGQIIIAVTGTAGGLTHHCLRRLNLYYPRAMVESPGALSSYDARTFLLEDGAPAGIMSIPMSVADRELFYRTHGYHLLEVPVALDAIQVIAHKDNPLQEITIPQLDAVYGTELLAGETALIRTWGDLGLSGEWADAAIEAWGVKNLLGGTVSIFQQRILQDGPFRPDLYTEALSYLSLINAVAQSKFAIGFSNAQYHHPGAKKLALARNSGQKAYLPTADSVYGGHYPLTRYLYLYINAPSPDKMDPIVREFVSILLSREGQTAVAQVGQLPLSITQVKQARRQLGL